MSVTNMNIHQFLQFPILRDTSSLTLNLNTIQFSFLVLGLIHFSLFQFLLARKRDVPTAKLVETKAVTKLMSDHPKRFVSETDMEMLLRSLGMVSNDDNVGGLPSTLDSSDIFEMFEARSPCLDEVKEAFDVMDNDKDGFIDSHDLQTSMRRLGLKEGMELGNCSKMIGLYDENGDGRLDVQEFVNFMENSFA